MSKYKRSDNNTKEIKAAVTDCGWEFIDTHNLGDGFPDALAVKWDGREDHHAIWRTIWLEIKTKTGRLTPDERTFQMRFPGLVNVVRSRDDVIKLLWR